MSARLRSSSVGSRPRPRLQRTSRAESAAALALDVRCACQYYESKSLLPERVNPVGYNAAEEFGSCVHVQARLKERTQTSESEMGFPITSTTIGVQSNIARPASPQPPQTNVYNLPPEFAPENVNMENHENDMESSTSSPPLGNRSVSCANMGAQPPTPQFIRQRDPSTSSLLRKRMSEERQGFSVLNKRMSQSTVSRDRFITQKDPSQSTILRRKMSNRSSASFDRASSEMVSNEHLQRFPIQLSRIPNERTFYHDTNDVTRNSNLNIDSPKMEIASSSKGDFASPLSMNSQGNRRFVLSSTENLQQIPDLYAKTSVETEPDSGIDSIFVDDPPRKTDIEKQLMMKNERSLHNRNVSDEEKVQILLSKTQNLSPLDIYGFDPNANAAEMRPIPTQRKKNSNESEAKKPFDSVETEKLSPRPIAKMRHKHLVSVNNVKAMEMFTTSKPQSVTAVENTLRPYQAQSSEYSFSKLFDNYKTPERQLSQKSNASTPDLGPDFIRQRDPSRSQFAQNRYRTIHSTTPTATAFHAPTPLSMDMITSHDKLLPPAGNYPERRASEISNPQSNQSIGTQFIKQKDMRTSNILNRRRRNLSQTSLSHDIGMIDDSSVQPVKVVKTISFEKNLSQLDSDTQISPYTGTNVKISKGVSFEIEKPLPADRNAHNMFDLSNSSANRRPYR